ncbi:MULTISPECIES: hypothetical protein [Streptomyces]|nr:hypothetical protein [Streptomyces sp. SID685]
MRYDESAAPDPITPGEVLVRESAAGRRAGTLFTGDVPVAPPT